MQQEIINQTNEAATINKPKSSFLTYLGFSILGLLIVIMSISQITDDDVFWHLATGKWIVEHRVVPDQDVFGFLTEGKPWIPFEWVWDLLNYFLYSLTGNYVGVQILPAIIWLCIASLLIFTMRRLKISTNIILVVMLITFLASLYSQTQRPTIMTLLGFSTVIFIYFKFRYSTSIRIKRLIFLPLVFIVWTNLHPGVLVGLLLLFIFLTSEIFLYFIEMKKKATEGKQPAINAESILTFQVIIALCILALLFNPHGLSTFDYIYSHTKLKMLSTIREWMPTLGDSFQRTFLWFYKILLLLGGLSLFYSIKKRDPIPALLYIIFMFFSLRAVRFIPDFAVVTAVGTALGMSYLLKILPKRLRLIIDGNPVSILIIVLMLVGIYGSINGSLYTKLYYHRHFGFGKDEHYFSKSLIDFIKTQKISGRPFNQFEIGGELIWEIPEEKNFIDSRNLGDDIGEEYYSILGKVPGFEDKLNLYEIEYIVHHIPEMDKSPTTMQNTLIPYCSTHPGLWKLVYWDDRSILYLKNIPKFKDIIDKFEYKILDPYRFAYRTAEFDSLCSAMPLEFEKEFNRRSNEQPKSIIINFISRHMKGEIPKEPRPQN